MYIPTMLESFMVLLLSYNVIILQWCNLTMLHSDDAVILFLSYDAIILRCYDFAMLFLSYDDIFTITRHDYSAFDAVVTNTLKKHASLEGKYLCAKR